MRTGASHTETPNREIEMKTSPPSDETRHPTRLPWRAPALEMMPALKVLTLQSLIRGGEGGFSFLNAADPTKRLG